MPRKSKFGGVGPSSMVKAAKKYVPFAGTHIEGRWGLNYFYTETGKIMSDEDTSIYFGTAVDNFGNKIDDIVVKIINQRSPESEQLMNENMKLIVTTGYDPESRYIPIKYEFIVPTAIDKRYKLIMKREGESLDRFGKLPANVCVSILYQSIEALQFLHSCGFAHNDIKPGNLCIGLKDPQNLKIIDLGISERFSKKDENYPRIQNRINGSPYYVSPEIFQGKDKTPVSRKHDLQSMLYVVLELYLGNLPWKDIRIEGVPLQQVPGIRKQIADSKEIYILNLIDSCYEQPEFRRLLTWYYEIIWNMPLLANPNYIAIMHKIRRYPGFIRDIVIKKNNFGNKKFVKRKN